MAKLLENIESAIDLHAMSTSELEQVATEITEGVHDAKDRA